MTEFLAADDLDLRRIVRPGDTVLWTQGAGEPLTLVERLLEQRTEIGPFQVLLGASYSGLVRPEHADVISFQAFGAVGTNRALCAAGVLDVLPIHLSDVPRLLSTGGLTVNVLFLQVSAPTGDRGYTLGAVNGYVHEAIRAARVVIAEINDQAPATYAHHKLEERHFHFGVRTSRPLVEVPVRPACDLERRVAENVVCHIPDGAILQLGIGGVPGAVAQLLSGHRNLGLHSGVIGDAVVPLIESGAITNATKTIDKGISVTGGLVGTRALYEFAHLNPGLLVESVTYTHDQRVLREQPRLTAINSALEVDLTGQIGAEVAGHSYIGTVGGQIDFVRGALGSPGGRSIIGLPSRGGRSQRSRIVPTITSGVVTTARSDADIIVTEFGSAELRGRSIHQRVRSMIAIAHSDDRDQLEEQARRVIVGYT